MTSFEIPPAMVQAVIRHAEKEYPFECCGLLFGADGDPSDLSDIFPCRNLQNEYHRLDPAAFPRTAQTAYFLDPEQLLKIQKETRSRGLSLRGIYHSHINARSDFSGEDKRMALYQNEPVYPGVFYFIAAVHGGRVRNYSLYEWDQSAADFRRVFFKEC